jgi:hypothetical protein
MLDKTEQQELDKVARELIAEQLRELYLSNGNEIDRNYLFLNNGHSKKMKFHLTKDHLVKRVREELLNAQQNFSPEVAVEQEIRKIHLPQAGDPFENIEQNEVKKIDKAMNAIKWRKFDVFTPFYIEHMDDIFEWFEKHFNCWKFWLEKTEIKDIWIVKCMGEN